MPAVGSRRLLFPKGCKGRQHLLAADHAGEAANHIMSKQKDRAGLLLSRRTRLCEGPRPRERNQHRRRGDWRWSFARNHTLLHVGLFGAPRVGVDRSM